MVDQPNKPQTGPEIGITSEQRERKANQRRQQELESGTADRGLFQGLLDRFRGNKKSELVKEFEEEIATLDIQDEELRSQINSLLKELRTLTDPTEVEKKIKQIEKDKEKGKDKIKKKENPPKKEIPKPEEIKKEVLMTLKISRLLKENQALVSQLQNEIKQAGNNPEKMYEALQRFKLATGIDIDQFNPYEVSAGSVASYIRNRDKDPADQTPDEQSTAEEKSVAIELKATLLAKRDLDELERRGDALTTDEKKQKEDLERFVTDGHSDVNEDTTTPSNEVGYQTARNNIMLQKSIEATRYVSPELQNLDEEGIDTELVEFAVEVKEVREALAQTEHETIRMEITTHRIQQEIFEAIAQSETPEDAQSLISDERIRQIIVEMYPVDMASIVEAASSDNKDARDNLRKMKLRREILEDTMKRQRDAMYRNFIESGEFINDPNKLQELFKKRKGRLDSAGNPNLSENDMRVFRTREGYTVAIFDDADKFVDTVAPKLRHDKSEDELERDQLVSHLQEVTSQEDGYASAQMAVKIESDDGTEPSNFMAIYVNKERLQKLSEDDYPGGFQGMLEAIGLDNNTPVDEDTMRLLSPLMQTGIIPHEVQHISQFHLNQAIQDALRDIENSDSDEDQKELARNFLKNLEENETIEENKETYLSELASCIMEKADRITGDGEQRDLTLADIYAYDPSEDPLANDNLEGLHDEMFEVIQLVNEILRDGNEERVRIGVERLLREGGMSEEGIQREMQRLSTEYGRRFYLATIIDTYTNDPLNRNPNDENYGLNPLKKVLKKIANIDEENFSEDIEIKKQDKYKLPEDIKRIWGELSEVGRLKSKDKNIRLKDPIGMINAMHERSPLYPNRFKINEHQIVPLMMMQGGGLPIVGGFAQWANARLRWHTDSQFQDKFGYFDNMWEQIKSDPMRVTQKAKPRWGGAVSDDILQGLFRQIAVSGKTVEELGDQVKLIDPNTKQLKGRTENVFDVGPVGRVLHVMDKGLDKVGLGFTKFAPAPWGDYKRKLFGRGRIAAAASYALLGKNSGSTADRIDFLAPPNVDFVAGYREEDIKKGYAPMAPDGKPRVIKHEYGNMMPRWNHGYEDPQTGKRVGRWEAHPYMPYESVQVTMEANRAISLNLLLGLMTKTGIDESSIRFMLMQNLPELNFRTQGAPNFDLTEFKKPLRRSDLKYKERLESNRRTIAKYVQDLKTNLLGDANFDGEDEHAIVQQYYAQNGQGLDPLVNDQHITRGHVDDETIEGMLEIVREWDGGPIGESPGGGPMGIYGQLKKAKMTDKKGNPLEGDGQYAMMVDHVHRAMQYENSIRHLRRKYLTANPNLQASLQAIQNDIDSGTKFDDALNNAGQIQMNYNGQNIVLNAEKIKKLFGKQNIEGEYVGIVSDTKDEANSTFGFGDLEKMAFNSEWNSAKGTAGTNYVNIGGGFRLHKNEIQVFQRLLYMRRTREVLEKGAPADAIFIPGETPQTNRTLRADLWNEYPQMGSLAIRNPNFDVNQPPSKDNPTTIPGTYRQHFIERFKTAYQLHQAPQQTLNKLGELLGVQGAITAQSIEQKFGNDFQAVVNACETDQEFMWNVFGERAGLQSMFTNEKNEMFGIKPIPPAKELIFRYFEQGAMFNEIEENILRAEEQNRFYLMYRNFLNRARESIIYSKARSEVFKKRALYFKYFRWLVVGYTAASILLPGVSLIPMLASGLLPLSPGVYLGTIALSFYESLVAERASKYWSARELGAIKYADEVWEITDRLEAQIREFKVPSGEQQEQNISFQNRYEKMFEKIAEPDTEEIETKNNLGTLAASAVVGGVLGMIINNKR